jgi:hypothetical protein
MQVVKVRDSGAGSNRLPPIVIREWETATGVGTANSVKIFQVSGRDLDAGRHENGRGGGDHRVYVVNIEDDDWGPRKRMEYEDEGSEMRSDDHYGDIKFEV